MAGWPLTSNGAVLTIISVDRAMLSSRATPAGGIPVATIGSAGVSGGRRGVVTGELEAVGADRGP